MTEILKSCFFRWFGYFFFAVAINWFVSIVPANISFAGSKDINNSPNSDDYVLDKHVEQFDSWVFERGKLEKPVVHISTNYTALIITPDNGELAGISNITASMDTIFRGPKTPVAFKQKSKISEFFSQ